MALRLDDISGAELGLMPLAAGDDTATQVLEGDGVPPALLDLRDRLDAAGILQFVKLEVSAAEPASLEQAGGAPDTANLTVLTKEFPARGVAKALLARLFPPKKDGSVEEPKPDHLEIAKRFIALEVLGRGGQGVATLAFDTQTRDIVVLKSPQGRLTQLDSARFAREREILRDLDGKHAPHLIESGANADGNPFFAMQLLKGYPLNKLHDAKGGAWPEDAAVSVVRQVAASMAYIHERIGPHRDLKPGNIILQDDGTVKIVDFGLAAKKKAEQSSQMSGATGEYSEQLTADHSVFGTPAYMSPEQAIDSGDVDVRTDVYSLGVMLLEMLTNKNPFSAPRPQQAFALHANHEPDLSTIRNTRLAAVLCKMLAKKVEGRYGSMQEVAAALAAATRKATNVLLMPPVEAGPDAPMMSDHESPATMVKALVRANGRPDLAIAAPTTTRRLTRYMHAHAAAIALVVGSLVVLGGGAVALTASGKKENANSGLPVDVGAQKGVAGAAPPPPLKLKESVAEKYRKLGKHPIRVNIDDQQGLTHLELPHGVAFERDQIVQLYGKHPGATAGSPEVWLGAYVELDPEQQVRLYRLVEPGEPVTAADIRKLPQNTTHSIRVRIFSAPSDGKRCTAMVIDSMGGLLVDSETVDVDGRPMQLGESHFPGSFVRELAPVKAVMQPRKTFDELVLRPDVQAALHHLKSMESRVEAGARYNTVQFGPETVLGEMTDYAGGLIRRAERLRNEKGPKK